MIKLYQSEGHGEMLFMIIFMQHKVGFESSTFHFNAANRHIKDYSYSSSILRVTPSRYFFKYNSSFGRGLYFLK